MKQAMRREIILKGGVAVASSVALFAVACGSFRDGSTALTPDGSVDEKDASPASDLADGAADAATQRTDSSVLDASAVSPCAAPHSFCYDFDGDGGLKVAAFDGGVMTPDTWDAVRTKGTPVHGVSTDGFRSSPRSYRIELTSDEVQLQKSVTTVERVLIAFDLLPSLVPKTPENGVVLTLERKDLRVVVVSVALDSKKNFFATIRDGTAPASDAVPIVAERWNHVEVMIGASSSRLTVSPEGSLAMAKTVTGSATAFPGGMIEIGFRGTGTWKHFLDNVVVDLLAAPPDGGL